MNKKIEYKYRFLVYGDTWITDEGFGGLAPPPPQREIDICKAWISKWITKRKTINHMYTSYAIKHVIEEFDGSYASNGSFIQAAIELGYEVQMVYGGSINVYFNMSFNRVEKCLREKRSPTQPATTVIINGF